LQLHGIENYEFMKGLRKYSEYVLEHGEFLCRKIVSDSNVFQSQFRYLTLTIMQERVATFG
jgi:hypothetical protein